MPGLNVHVVSTGFCFRANEKERDFQPLALGGNVPQNTAAAFTAKQNELVATKSQDCFRASCETSCPDVTQAPFESVNLRREGCT